MVTNNTNVHGTAGAGAVTTANDFFKDMTNHVKKDDKKETLARFFTMLVKTGQDLTPHMGKPMSNYDFNKIFLVLEEYENRQQKLPLETEPDKAKAK